MSRKEKLYQVVSDTQVVADDLVKIIVSYFFSSLTSQEQNEYILNLLSRPDWENEIKFQDEDDRGDEIDAIADHLKECENKDYETISSLPYCNNVRRYLRAMRTYPLQRSQKFPKVDSNYLTYQLKIPNEPELKGYKYKLQVHEFRAKLFTNENFVARPTDDAAFIKSGPFLYGLGIDLSFSLAHNLEYRVLYLLSEKREIPLLQIMRSSSRTTPETNYVGDLLDWFIPFQTQRYAPEFTMRTVNTRRLVKMLMASTIIKLSEKLRDQLVTMSKQRLTQKNQTELNELLWEFASVANNFVKSYAGINFDVVQAVQPQQALQRKDESQLSSNQARFSFPGTGNSTSSSDSTCLIM